eukprot:COSAG02_NODE_99_length_37069_cov_24.910957_10_plen_79_part_00
MFTPIGTFLKYSPRSPPRPLHEPEIAESPNYSPNQPISGPTSKTNAHFLINRPEIILCTGRILVISLYSPIKKTWIQI